MSVRMRDLMAAQLGELRWEPTTKRVRAEAGGVTILDSTRAALLWEPKRIVPAYAVPVEDVLVPVEPDPAPAPDGPRRPVLDPSVPFGVHTAAGEPVRIGGVGAYRLAEGDVAGWLVVDFGGPDAWYEEDEPIVSHPHDPYARIDVRRSSRHVRFELDGELLAESTRPTLLFETGLPVRFYLPREDVRSELRPSGTRTWCAYKGQASYLSPVVAGSARADLVWFYPDPLLDAEPVTGLLGFFDEKLDVTLDGVRRDRPLTPWS